MTAVGSNFLQLMTLSVGARDIAKGFTTKLVEIDQHLRNLERAVEIDALIAQHRDDAARVKRLEAEKKLRDDAKRREELEHRERDRAGGYTRALGRDLSLEYIS